MDLSDFSSEIYLVLGRSELRARSYLIWEDPGGCRSVAPPRKSISFESSAGEPELLAMADVELPDDSTSLSIDAVGWGFEGNDKNKASAPPPWAIGFSKKFRKDTASLDRKIQGRLLEVLEEVSDFTYPFKPRGDTFKPLVGELSGYWRYRLGDSRLVILPDFPRAHINAVAFGARGGIYD